MSAFHGNLSRQRQQPQQRWQATKVHTNPSSSNDAGMTANSSRQNAPKTPRVKIRNKHRLLLQRRQPDQTAIHHQARSKIHGRRADGGAVGWIKAKTPRSRSNVEPGMEKSYCYCQGYPRKSHFWESPERAGGGLVWVRRLREEPRHGHLRGGHRNGSCALSSYVI